MAFIKDENHLVVLSAKYDFHNPTIETNTNSFVQTSLSVSLTPPFYLFFFVNVGFFVFIIFSLDFFFLFFLSFISLNWFLLFLPRSN